MKNTSTLTTLIAALFMTLASAGIASADVLSGGDSEGDLVVDGVGDIRGANIGSGGPQRSYGDACQLWNVC